jgi:RNA polymerase sigma-70 factor (ECF subfamily)
MGEDRAHDMSRRPREPALAEWFAQGDDHALHLLYRHYASRLHAFCLRRLGNHADADDAVQETFLKAQRALHRFDRSAPAWPWLVTIAAHVCTDIHRLNAHVADRDADDEVVGEPDEVLAAKARTAIVDDALRSLPDPYRTSIYLKHFEGASYEEIARLQGTSLASVRTTLMRGRRRLGARIETLARAERQWPLPSGVSVAARRARDRVRVWCRDCGRALQGAIGLVDAAASLNSLYAHAPVAVAVIGALVGFVGGSKTDPAHRPPAAAVPATAATTAPSGAILTIGDRRAGAVVTVGPARPPASPFFAFEVPRPPLAPEGAIPRTGAAAADNDDGSMQLYVEVLGYGAEHWTDCTERTWEQATCLAVRTALKPVEQHKSGTPGVVDVGEGSGRPS